jgi:hypothetical protein
LSFCRMRCWHLMHPAMRATLLDLPAPFPTSIANANLRLR